MKTETTVLTPQAMAIGSAAPAVCVGDTVQINRDGCVYHVGELVTLVHTRSTSHRDRGRIVAYPQQRPFCVEYDNQYRASFADGEITCVDPEMITCVITSVE